MFSESKTKSILGLLKDVSIYGVGSILSRFLGVIITPILTRIFTVAEYGQLDIIQSGLSIVIAISSLYMESAVMRYYYDCEDKERKKLLFTHLMTIVFIGISCIIVVMPASDMISEKVFGSSASANIIGISAYTILTALLYQHIITILRTMRKAHIVIIYSFFVALLQFLLVLLLTLRLKYGIEGVLLARIFSEGILSVVIIVFLRSEYCLNYSFKHLKKMLRFGMPLLPDVFMGIIIGYFGKFFLMTIHGNSAVGIFSVAQKAALAIVIFLGAFKSAWIPYALSISDRKDNKEIYSHILSAYMKVNILISAFLIIFAREIVLILAPEEYLSATFVLGLLIITASLQGSVYILNIGILIVKKTEHYMLASLFASLITVILSALLIPRMGIAGAGIVQLAGQIVMVGVVYKVAQHFYRIQYKTVHIVMFILLTSLVSLINLNENLTAHLGFKSALACIIGISGYFLLKKEIKVVNDIVLQKIGVHP